MNQKVGSGRIPITLCRIAAGCAFVVIGACSSRSDETESLATTSEELTIHAPEAAVNSFFGTSVAADTQTLVVGDYGAFAPTTLGMTAQRGQVHVYTRTGDIQEWQPLQVLKPDSLTRASEIHFGEVVALKNNLLVISAHRDDSAADGEEGAFYVYSRPGSGQAFTRVGKFTEPVPTFKRRFGGSIATNGNFIAVGRGPEGESDLVHVYRVSGNTVTYGYAIDIGVDALEVAITDSGVLIARPAGPNLHAYHLQENQAVPLSGTELLTGNFWRLQASGNSFAAIEQTTAARVIVGKVDTARVTSVTSFELPSSVGNAQSLSYLENQHILVPNRDPVRPGLVKFQPQGAGWTQSGTLYAPPEAHVIGSNLGKGIASTGEFAAAGIASDSGKVFVFAPDPNGVFDGAVFDQQQLLARDACGAQCGTQSFGAAHFGRYAAISGDVAAVATTEQTTPAPRESALHIYARSGSSFQHAGQFFLGSTQRARDVAVHSGRVFVGHGTMAGPGGFSDGAVSVYERDGSGVWAKTATLTSADGSLAAEFIGESIAAHGDTVALGTPGFVYIFQRDASGVWMETHKLPVTPVGSQLPLAHSVALSADHLVAGARLDSSVLDRQGSVFVFRRSDYALEQKVLTSGSAIKEQEFGYAVAVNGTTIAAGAPNGADGGYVEIFERTGTGTTPWQRSTSLRPQNGGDYRVGTSVSLAEGQLLLGAVGDPFTGAQGGAAYLVPRVGGVFDMARAHVLLPRDNGRGDGAGFGWAVQLSGTSAIVSAPGTDVESSGDAGAAYIFENLVDADADGLLASEDCNDTDGVARRCSVSAANMSFEQSGPAWTADSGSFTYNSANRSDGISSLRLNAGSVRLRGPSFSTSTLREVGTTLALDLKRPTVNGNAVSLFMSAPAFGLFESLIGTIDISTLPAGKWVTVSAPFTAQQRDILLRQNTDVRFHVALNTGGPNLYVDRLHFSGQFEGRLAPPPPTGPFFATLNVTTDWGAGYCVTIRLNNAGTTPTAGFQLVVNPNGTSMTSNWNAAFSGTNPITITSNQAWNSSIPAGATNHDVSAGFCANRTSGGSALPSVTSATRL
jgi:hypothetical protein